MSADGLELSATAQDGPTRPSRSTRSSRAPTSRWRSTRSSSSTASHAVEGDEVVLETLDPLKPATLRGTDQPEFLYLLMPVRIS